MSDNDDDEETFCPLCVEEMVCNTLFIHLINGYILFNLFVKGSF